MCRALLHKLSMGVLLILVGSILILLTACATTTGGNNSSLPAGVTITPETSQPVYPARTPQQPQGVPAIQPRTNGTPAFTQDDVAQYVKTHPMPRNLAKETAFTIVLIKFLPSKDVSALLGGEYIGVPDTMLLCYVELQGTFTFAGPGGKTVTFQRGFEVFDAHTGNLLMQGGLENPIQ